MTLTLPPETEARLQALVAQRNEAVEADAEQKRMRDLLAAVQAQARLLPLVSPEQRTTGSSAEEQAFGEVVAEKFRKQGFNV